jgi:hypothetical protein
VRVFISDLPVNTIFNLENGKRWPKNLDFGFLAPFAMIEIFPEDSEKTSAMIEVSPNDRACSKKQHSQL